MPRLNEGSTPRFRSTIVIDAIGPMLKLLFVCSRNRIRSLTAERIFSSYPGIQVRSAGTQPGARIVITEGHIGWADIVFCMEKSHLARIRLRYPEALEGKRVVNLMIPDDYELMQLELMETLQEKVSPYISGPTDSLGSLSP